jgi:predicted nucleic acid-binding protein
VQLCFLKKLRNCASWRLREKKTVSFRNVHYVVDSSVWIELFAQKPSSEACLKEIKSDSEHQGLTAVATMSQYRVLDLTRDIALSAADIAIRAKLAMADSLMLAHARSNHAVLLTLDNDFAGLADTKVLRKT